MSFRTLRSWLGHLQGTGRLAVSEPGVPLDFTLAALAKRWDGRKAVLFPSPSGFGDGHHSIPVVSGMISDRSWIAEAMGVSPEEVLDRFRRAAEAPLACRTVAAAPCQERVVRDPDLTRSLPIPKHNALDAGPYISAGLVIARNPGTGVQNVSINRLQITGPRRMGVLILPRDLHHFHAAAEARSEELPVAVVIGVDPLTLLASQAILPVDCDELEVAGALHGEPLPVAECRTNPLRVPASAEIVIEGRLLPGIRETEGPFGEFPQYYGPPGERPVIEVDAVTTRADPILHTIVPAAMEHLLLGAIPREATILSHLRRTCPTVLDVNLPRGGVCRYHLNVRMRKTQEGQTRNVIAAAFAAHADVKRVVVVDEDVDVHDPAAVEWAVATRFQAGRDLVLLPRALGSKLDPSADDGVSDKMGLDATMPFDRDDFTYRVVHVPGEDDPALDSLLTDRRWDFG